MHLYNITISILSLIDYNTGFCKWRRIKNAMVSSMKQNRKCLNKDSCQNLLFRFIEYIFSCNTSLDWYYTEEDTKFIFPLWYSLVSTLNASESLAKEYEACEKNETKLSQIALCASFSCVSSLHGRLLCLSNQIQIFTKLSKIK